MSVTVVIIPCLLLLICKDELIKLFLTYLLPLDSSIKQHTAGLFTTNVM